MKKISRAPSASRSPQKKRLWFAAKHYGWGWYPSTWEGWALLVVYLTAVFADFWRINLLTPFDQSAPPLNFLFDTFILTFLLIVICYLTGEEPHWRWGTAKKK